MDGCGAGPGNGETKMTYAQALMIVRNATSGYTATEIRAAAVHVAGSLDASEEDILDAGSALGYADQMNVKVSYAPEY